MAMFRLTHKVTGEKTDVGSTNMVDIDDWNVVEILDDRVPVGIEDVDEEGNIFIPVPALQAQIWAKVKDLREQKKLLAPTTFGTAQSDVESRLNITGLVAMAREAKDADAPFLEVFTMEDNSEVELDADQMISFGVQVGSYIATVHARARALREAIYDSGATVESLTDIDIDAGWPTV